MSLQIPTTIFASSPRRSSDELFFDCPTPPRSSHGTSPIPKTPAISIPYVLGSLAAESAAASEPLDWRRYAPPRELKEFKEPPSQEIQRLLPETIETIRRQLVDDEERKRAGSKPDRPILRKARATSKPKLEIATNDPLSTSSLSPDPRENRLSGSSATSLLSADSGYATMSHRTPSPSRTKISTRRPFSLSSLLTRAIRLTSDSDSNENVSGLSSTIEETEPSTAANLQLSQKPATKECVSCLEDFKPVDTVELPCHSYCKECFHRLITTALESEAQFPPKCCLNPIRQTILLSNISATIAKRYHVRKLEFSTPASERTYCAHPPCNTFIPPSHISSAERLRHTPSNSIAKCPTCHKTTCRICHSPSHPKNADCPSDPEILMTENLAENSGWKKCYNCKSWVEHNNGCRHMTCRCKAQWCFVCLARWKTCQCTDAMVGVMIAEAQRRGIRQDEMNEERRRREEEERENLRLVEEFERAEIRRREMEMEVERLRLEEERIRRQEERVRNELLRREAILHRYIALKKELGMLNNQQQSLMIERHTHGSSILETSITQNLSILKVQHAEQLIRLRSSTSQKLAEIEEKFDKEYWRRLLEEKKIEDKYFEELSVYWEGKSGGGQMVRRKRDELKQALDREFGIWDAWAKKEIDGIKMGEIKREKDLEDGQGKEERELLERGRVKIEDCKKRIEAERKWMEEAAKVRGKILSRMERNEYDQGSVEEAQNDA